MHQPRARAQPLVSVVIPVHNGERFIDEAIQSVLSQTLKDIELIIVDDGSTDRTAEIASAFTDPRLRLVRESKRGISGAINVGIDLSRAELIARLDADDIMEPERLERQLAYLRDRPWLGGAASYYWVIDEHGRKCSAADPHLLELEDLERQLRHGGRLTYPHPTVTMRKAAVQSVGLYDSRFDACEDVELFMRMYEANLPVLVQPERLTRFRIHPHSVTATQAARQFFLNETIFGNYERRKRGEPALPLEAYVAAAQANLGRRIVTGARIQARRLLRATDVAKLRGRFFLAAITLVGAALLDMRTTVGALRRKLRRTLDRRAR